MKRGLIVGIVLAISVALPVQGQEKTAEEAFRQANAVFI